MKQIKCKKCGLRFGDGFDSCPYCGARQSEVVEASGSWLFPAHVGKGAKSMFVVAVLFVAVTVGVALGGGWFVPSVTPTPGPSGAPSVETEAPASPTPEQTAGSDAAETASPAPTKESDPQGPDAAGPNGSLTNDPPAEETLYYYRVLLHFLYYDAAEQWTEYRRADFVPTDGEPTVFTYSDVFESKDVEFDLSDHKLEDYYPSREYSFDPSTLEGKELAGCKVGRYSIKFPIREGSPNPVTFNMLDAGPTSLEGSTEQNPATVHLWFVAFESGEHIPLELDGIDVREPRYYFCLHYTFGNQETQDRNLTSGCARLQLFVPASLQYNDGKYDSTYATRLKLKDVQTLTEAKPDAPNIILIEFVLPYTQPPATQSSDPKPTSGTVSEVPGSESRNESGSVPVSVSVSGTVPVVPGSGPESSNRPPSSTRINPETPREEQPVPPELINTSHS